MLILQTDKNNAIRQLERYSASLNGGRVKQNVYKKIAEVYQIIQNRTTNSARYIEAKEQEIDNVLTEYLSYMCKSQNLTACVYLGRRTSVYAREKIENALNNMVAVYSFPAAYETDRIIIYVSFINNTCGELYDIDYGMSLLNYDR